jgi:hypothetical protein
VIGKKMSAAEPVKRASFLTVGSSSDFLKKPDKDTATKSEKGKSLRLNLDLFEPDLNTFPEFNYKRLLHIEKVISFFFSFLLAAALVRCCCR